MPRRPTPSAEGTDNHRQAPRRIASAIVQRLAKLFLKSGLSFGDFQEISRSAFCHAAEDHVAAAGARPTTSRIAVLTGLSRADVAKTRKQSGLPESRAHYKPRTDRVMHGWRSDPLFTDISGRPAALPRRGARSIEELCRRYSGDIPTKALLEELLARNLIREVAGDIFEPCVEDSTSPHTTPLDADEISACADVFFDANVEDEARGASHRITASFPSNKIPSHVVRTCRQRTAKFLEALSSYIHAESLAAAPSDNQAISTINVLILSAEREISERDAEKERHASEAKR